MVASSRSGVEHGLKRVSKMVVNSELAVDVMCSGALGAGAIV